MSGGCARCSTPPPHPCCDLCDPRAFDDLFALMEPPPRPPPRPSKSSLKEYVRGEPELRLSQALGAWRRATTIKKFGHSILRDVGSSLVLTNDQLERLVDCAHFGKITNVEQLKKEVRWALIDEFGQDVVQIIMTECPPQPRVRTRRKKTTASKRSRVRRPLGTNTRLLNAQPVASTSGVSTLLCIH